MDTLIAVREIADNGFVLRISFGLPVEKGEFEWRADYEVDVNSEIRTGYALSIDGLGALLNAILEARRICSSLSAGLDRETWHMVPYIAPIEGQIFDEYAEMLVKSARNFYWKHKTLPPLPPWSQDERI